MKIRNYILTATVLLGVCACSEVGDLDGVVVRKEYKQSANPTLRVGKTSLSFESAQGQQTFTIESNANWAITAPDWCSLSATSGTGNATITIAVGENTSQDERSGDIVVSGPEGLSATIKVTQAGKPLPPAPTLAVNAVALTFESAQGQQSFTIESNVNWTITAPDWCSLSATSGTGNATITVAVGENTSQDERSGDIVVSGPEGLSATIKVTQAGKPQPPAPTLAVNATALTFESVQGQQSFTIESNANWTITAPDWCSLSATSGTGNATITVAVGENASQEERSGSIVVSGPDGLSATIEVTQAGKPYSGIPGSGDNEPPGM